MKILVQTKKNVKLNIKLINLQKQKINFLDGNNRTSHRGY